MPSSLQPSRLARYSLAATTAAVGSGGAAVADVISGSFDISFGRSAGSIFFNGFSSSSSSSASASVAMGDLSISLYGYQGYTFADAAFGMTITDGISQFAILNQSTIVLDGSGSSAMSIGSTVNGGAMVDAGAVWQAGATTTDWSVQVFWTYFNTVNSTSSTWTNPNATGTKFVNFFIDGDDGDIYGWIQLDWNITDANDWSLTITNWAYSDDGPLAAGSTGAPVVPGLGGLAALAIGAAGVRGRRQRIAG